MTVTTKVLLIGAGYLAAGLVAALAVALNEALTPASLGSDGMYAFGDLLLFITVFAIAAIFPTCATIYFLRASRFVNARTDA